MTDRILKVRENGSHVARGFYRDRQGFYAADQDTNDKLTYDLDLSDWLGSDTISSVAYEDKNLTRSVSETTTKITFTISGVKGGGNSTDYGSSTGAPAYTRARVTTANGLIKDFTLRFYEREM